MHISAFGIRETIVLRDEFLSWKVLLDAKSMGTAALENRIAQSEPDGADCYLILGTGFWDLCGLASVTTMTGNFFDSWMTHAFRNVTFINWQPNPTISCHRIGLYTTVVTDKSAYFCVYVHLTSAEIVLVHGFVVVETVS